MDVTQRRSGAIAKYIEKQATPNEDLDFAVASLLKKAKGADCSPELAAKLINTAINWEKVKHSIMDKEEEFDPDEL